MGAAGGLLFLIGAGIAFYAHKHMGEAPFEVRTRYGNYYKMNPLTLFIIGIIIAGFGAFVGAYALAKGEQLPDYNTFFKQTSSE